MLRNDRDCLTSLQVPQKHQKKLVDGFRNRNLVPIGPYELRVPLLDQTAQIADLGSLGLWNGDGIGKSRSHTIFV
jgi:hypothetical protein